jgi:hypothetical protein
MKKHLQKVGNKQKNLKKKIFFVGVLKVSDENSRVRRRIRSISQRHGSADSYLYVTDPQHLTVS